MDEDLIGFLEEGPKVGEKVFRDRFGFCPRKLLNMLVGTYIYKYKERGLVAYRLMEDVFFNDPNLENLQLDNNEIIPSSLNDLILEPVKETITKTVQVIDKTDITEEHVWEMQLPFETRRAFLSLSEDRRKEVVGLSEVELNEILFPKRKLFSHRVFRKRRR